MGSADQGVEVVYTPSGADGLVYLNGFEIDTPALKDQISFPSPPHRDEHLELGDEESITATWRAPSSGDSVTYNVYMGNSSDALNVVEEGLSETQVVLSGTVPCPSAIVDSL